MNRIGHWDVVPRGQRLVIPTITEGDREHGIALAHHVLPGGHRRPLRCRAIAVDDPRPAACVGTGSQQGTQDKANHQSLKACFTHTLRNDCETHPPLPLWWLKHERLYQA